VSDAASATVAAAGPRTWLITGSSTGLGRALAEVVLDQTQDNVIATAREPRDITDLSVRAPGRVLCQRLDVTDAASIHGTVQAGLDAFDAIDVLVNNAGYGHRGALEEFSDAELRQQFDVNVFGLVAVTRAVLPGMRRRRRGLIVQMSSVGGVVTTVSGTVYGATKFTLEGLSEGLAAEVAHLGIRVMILEPGPFRTDFAGRSSRWVAEPIDDYEPVIEPARQSFAEMHGTQPGDPHRAAQAVVRASLLAEPPLRLPLGPESFARIRARLQERLQELDRVEALGASTSFVPA